MYAVFSDLDGTILDFKDYSYKKAEEGIYILKKKKIPLILVSSKTLIEMKEIQKELRLTTPFIFENGGGIAFPSSDNTIQNNYHIETTGKEKEELMQKIGYVKKSVKTPIKTLFEMDLSEIIEMTNLSMKSAELIKKRSTTIPFVPINSTARIDIDTANSLLKGHKIAVTKGGRFYHFSSIEANKGNAVNKVIEYLKDFNNTNKIITIAVGDSENDIPMFKVVDIPVLVKKHDKTQIETGINIKKTESIGPEGFTEAIKSIFAD